MLKSMKPKSNDPQNIYLWALVGVLILAGLITLIVAFNGGEEDGAEEVNAVYTSAAETLAVQQSTLAASQPTFTPTVALPATLAVTNTPFASPTLFTSTLIPTATFSGVSGAVGCNNSLYVSDVTFPDDTAVAPGQAVAKTWNIKNTGTCPWTTSFKVSFVSGNAMGGTAVPFAASVEPGQSADVTVNMTAPTATGDVISYWILTNDQGQNFGSTFYVKLKVGGATTATATATGVVAAAPTAASGLSVSLTCALGGTGGTQKEHAGTLTWDDNSNNETGFNVYMNGTLLASVEANKETFTIPSGTFFDANVASTFAVEAYNTSGKATQAAFSLACQ